MVSGESQPKLPCVHSGGLWRPTKALRAGPPTLGGDAARSRPSASVPRGGWQEIPQRAPRLGSTPGPRSSTCDIQRFKNIPGSSPLTPAKGQPKGASGPPKGGLKGAAVRGVPLSSTAASEALAGDACPAGRGYNEARARGVPRCHLRCSPADGGTRNCSNQ